MAGRAVGEDVVSHTLRAAVSRLCSGVFAQSRCAHLGSLVPVLDGELNAHVFVLGAQGVNRRSVLGGCFVGRLPVWLQAAARWYACVFLLLFIVFCAVAWPAFSLSNLWRLVQ